MQPLQRRFIHRSPVPLRLKLRLLRRSANRAHLTIPNVSFTLETFSYADCVEKFRFTKTTLRSLANFLRIPARVVTACSAVEALCILLRRFAVPDRWSDLMSMFGRSRSGLCNIFLHVLDHIHNEFADIIFLDRISAKLADFSQAIVDKGGEVENEWAFIDGTVRECCRPGGDERQRCVFNGHKRRHAVKYQTLKMRIGKSPISKMYKVAVLLTNCITCDRGRNTNSVYFGLPPPSLEEYLHVNM
ncbi:hypothetical protein H257_16194 [Aphanomyces astaci]|uniref:DDE Tnp4 domain-containing protein n=1 Tax=Aphanomyces astaci TaxID=112090 RepID=W4FJF2_APHAT|nr:hypothetical protein H257_16194 [Aphanomyces astaci]ETV67595.1 hypothetical protein H257_16194 [Aphanomyces astaci]|eukprot:XP_009842852.1 hypothetical protein H257_16194 [Aphanomyces astaci]